MTAEIARLPNGLTVVAQPMSHLETTSLGLWVGVGARHEGAAEHGISHFLEHMSFKGTASRSAQAIAEEIEAVGGDLNAATGLEHTAYFARVLKGDEAVALDLIADILLSSSFAPDELEREREVILQEIAATEDSPEDIAYELVQEAAYPGQPVGRPILGSPANIRAFTGQDLRAFLATHYGPENMVLAAAGAVHPDALLRHAEALFGGLTRRGFGLEAPARYAGGTRAREKRFEQSHIILAFEGPSSRDREYYTAQVLSGLFGGGMSSRLFQEVREKRGLCYAIYSTAWGLKDTGVFAVHAATGAGTMGELIDVVGAEFERMGEAGPTEPEVARAKAQLRAGLLMSLESSSVRAEQLARQLLVHGRLISASELVAEVDRVTAEDVRRLAQRLATSPPSVAVVGAGKKSDALARTAALRIGRSSARAAAWHS